MFEHSVKVPRNFKISANIVKQVATKGGGVKSLLYDSKLRFFRTDVIYALITETIKHAADLDKLFEVTGILEKETRLDPWLARVITTELLFGKKELPGHSKPEQTILSYKEQFEKIPLQQAEIKTEVRSPRYVRVNTNLLTTSDAIRAFQDEGYRFIRCTSGSYNDYLKQIQGLSEYDFTQDYHVKTMFVFSPGTKFHDHDLYLENKIVLQSKSTALPVHLLAPPSGSVVLDMCAAPGMKTTQVAAFMRNQGKVYAVERDAERYKTLCDFVSKTESKCVTTMHRDCLDIKKGECEDVEYIILDPSCSGSGMQLSVHNYVDEVRLSRLTSLQEKFLKHAMNSFPNAKKIVYSTCSLFPEENERVISNVVKQSRAKWKVLNVKELLKEQWINYGSGMYGEIGTRCLYARPDSDFTTGFFLAVLERDPKQIQSTENGEDEKCKDKTNLNLAKRKLKNESKEITNDVEETSILDESAREHDTDKECKRKKKKKKDADLTACDDTEDAITTPTIIENEQPRKKTESDMNVETSVNPSVQKDTIDSENRKRKKKKHKDSEATSDITDGSDIKEAVESVLQNEEAEEIPKKKKKKKKYRDEKEVVTLEDPIIVDCNESPDVQDVTETVKKAKKRKKQCDG